MKKTCLITALFTAFAAVSPAVAQEISGNVSLASDYSFRGISQTSRDFAIQGGFDVEFDSGFSIGTWASNVNFGDSTSMELDLYMGFSRAINDNVSWGASFIRFEYPSEGEALDYIEIQFDLEIMGIGLGLDYSPEYVGSGGPSFTYPNASYSVALGDSASLDLGIGISRADADGFFAGEDSYVDYSATITTPLAGADFSIGLVGTNLDDDIADAANRVIVGLSKSL